jgi:hypothetical protein
MSSKVNDRLQISLDRKCLHSNNHWYWLFLLFNKLFHDVIYVFFSDILYCFSKFGDIFDEDYFIETLREHVRVVKKLPEDVLLCFNYNISSIPNMRTKAYSSPVYYVQKVLPKMLELGYDKQPHTPLIKRALSLTGKKAKSWVHFVFCSVQGCAYRPILE